MEDAELESQADVEMDEVFSANLGDETRRRNSDRLRAELKHDEYFADQFAEVHEDTDGSKSHCNSKCCTDCLKRELQKTISTLVLIVVSFNQPVLFRTMGNPQSENCPRQTGCHKDNSSRTNHLHCVSYTHSYQ